MMSSLHILKEANTFLDEIGAKIEPGSIIRLTQMRDEMVSLGFNAPFTALLKMTADELNEMEDSDFDDMKKQMKNIKYVAQLKKFTLRRVRVALAAHKIGEGAVKRGRGELLQFLPLDGNHVQRLSKTGEAGIGAYSELMKLIGESGAGYRAVVEVEVEVEGKKVKKQIKLEEGEKIDERVRREFGEKTELKGVKIVRASTPIIKNKSSRLALVCGEVSLAYAETRKALDEAEKDNAKVREYNRMLGEDKLERDVRIDLVPGFEKLKQKMIEKGLAKREKGEFLLDEELGAEIRRRRARLSQQVREDATRGSLSDMLRFYVLNGKSERESSTICPSLAVEPTKEQLGVFEPLSPLISVKNVDEVVGKKLEAEKLGLGLKSAPFGAAVFALESKKNAAWCAEFFGIDEKEISDAIDKVKAAVGAGVSGERGSGRGADFLKKLKKA